MRFKLSAVALAIVAVATSTAFLLRPSPHEPPSAAVLKPPASMPSVMSAYADADSALPVKQPSTAAARVRELAPTGSSLKAAYERLSKGTPVERVKAYELAERCLEVDKYRALEFERAARCGDPRGGGLEPGQIAGRLEPLHAAAEAGAPRAWYKLQAEADGYFSPGMLPADAQAKLDHYLEVAIEHGDPRAIQTVLPRLAASDKPEHAAKALELQVAVLLGLAEEFGERPPMALLTNGLASRLAAKLPSDEARRQAVQAGVDLAARAPKS
jgi:hypothetical protein